MPVKFPQILFLLVAMSLLVMLLTNTTSRAITQPNLVASSDTAVTTALLIGQMMLIEASLAFE